MTLLSAIGNLEGTRAPWHVGGTCPLCPHLDPPMGLSPMHTADADATQLDATQLSSCVASAVCIQFATSSRQLPTDSVDGFGKIEEKLLYGRPIETHQRSFERYHPRPPTASPFPKLGLATPTQNCNLKFRANEC